MTVTLKDLLVMLDIIIFAHIRFYEGEYSALLGTDNESRKELRAKIINNAVDILSGKNETKEIELTKTDLINLLGYSNPYHFELYDEYERRGRFTKEDIENLRERLEKILESKE